MATEFRRMQSLGGTAGDWATFDIVLLAREIGIETDAVPPRFKIGNGIDPWSFLPYAGETDITARDGLTAVESSMLTLDSRVTSLESATVDLTALQAQVDANTSGLATKQDQFGNGANAGDLVMWDGATAYQAVLLTLVPGSLVYWDGTQYVAIGAGSPGQALVWSVGGVPTWTTNPAAGVEEAPNDGVTYARLNEAWVALAPQFGVITESTTGRVLSAPDAGQRIRTTNVAGCTIDVPLNATVPFPVGTKIELEQASAGNLVVDPAVGVTVNRRATKELNTAEEFAVAYLVKVAANVWTLSGDLEDV